MKHILQNTFNRGNNEKRKSVLILEVAFSEGDMGGGEVESIPVYSTGLFISLQESTTSFLPERSPDKVGRYASRERCTR